jgi:hypothetical protein
MSVRQATLIDADQVRKCAALSGENWSDEWVREILTSPEYIVVLDDPDGMFWVRSTDGWLVQCGPHYGFAGATLARYPPVWAFTWKLAVARWPKFTTISALMNPVTCYAPGIVSAVTTTAKMAQVGITADSKVPIYQVSRATFEKQIGVTK